MTVVKADAYGHGLKQIAALLMQSGTDMFGVANLNEARVIRNIGPGWPVLMLGPSLPSERETVVRDHVIPTISSLEEAAEFALLAKRGKTVSVHVKVDTGMGRLGVRSSEAFHLIQTLSGNAALRLDGLYTHFSSVEDDPDASDEQERLFEDLLLEIRNAGIEIPLIHISNSGGVLLQKNRLNLNLVRPGLLVYGILPPGTRDLESRITNRVRPVLSFKCRVGFLKTISKGTALSYGKTFVARNEMRVATVTAGYGDGFLRSGSNRSQVLIGGRRCAVLGRITMDQTLVDVTQAGPVSEGDEVVMIGRQENEEITAGELAVWCGTIPWEVLTAITYRVPRVYRGSQAS